MHRARLIHRTHLYVHRSNQQRRCHDATLAAIYCNSIANGWRHHGEIGASLQVVLLLGTTSAQAPGTIQGFTSGEPAMHIVADVQPLAKARSTWA
jgi:hypothetical protein